MHKWKVLSGILLIFALGVLVGAVGTGLLFQSRIQHFLDPKAPPPPNQILFRELEKLNLSDDQWEDVNKLMDDMHQEITRRMKKTAPQIKQLFDGYVLKIGEELNSQQKKELTKALERIEERMKHMAPPPFREKGAQPPPPPNGDRKDSFSNPHEMRPPGPPPERARPPHAQDMQKGFE